jgi:hypothetical protein
VSLLGVQKITYPKVEKVNGIRKLRERLLKNMKG